MDEIPSLVRSNVRAFRILIPRLQLEEPGQAAIAESHFARFKVWTGSLGAEQSSSLSLTCRLRNSSRIQSHVISLLGELRVVLGQAFSHLDSASPIGVPQYDSIDVKLAKLLGDTNPSLRNVFNLVSELNKSLTQIQEIVDCLLRLSVTLSNPAPHDQFRSRVDIQEIHSRSYSINHLDEEFPNLDSAVIQRLSRAMAKRLQYIKYHSEQHLRLGESSELNEAEKARDEGGVTTALFMLSYDLHESTQIDVAASQNPASKISTTPYTRSNISKIPKVHINPLPREHTTQPFLCPFCFILISVETRDEWEKHIFEDLRPYVCIWNDCVSPEQDFQDRRDWIRHMTAHHWREWVCPFGCPTAFNDCGTLEFHLRNTHVAELSPERVTHLSALSSRTDLKKAKGWCPMCQKAKIETFQEYESHIGHHLEQIALFVLPAMRASDRDDHEAVKVENERDKETEKDRIASEPKAFGKLADMNTANIDAIHEHHEAILISPGPGVEASSGEEIVPAKAQKSHLETLSAENFQPDGGKGKQKSILFKDVPSVPISLPASLGPSGSQRPLTPAAGPGRLSPYSSGHQQQYMHNLGNPGQPMALVSHYSPAASAAAYGGHFGGMLFQSQKRHPDKPHQCDQCPTAFARNHDLKRHKRIHWAVKPFPCDGCEKAFSRKDALKRHKLVKCCGKDSGDKTEGDPSSTKDQGSSDNAVADNAASQ